MDFIFSVLNRPFIYLIVLSLYFSLNTAGIAQTSYSSSNKYLDFSAVESYFLLTDKLETSIEPTDQDWQNYFETPINRLMIYGRALDTTAFRSSLRNAYLTNSKALSSEVHSELIHHLKYKKHQKQLKEHISFLKSSNVVDSIQKYLYPYLPERLRSIENLPKQYYVFYGEEDATGGGGMVINDLLLSYKIDTYHLGLLSAHEAFHSIVSTSFVNMITNQSGDNDLNIDLLYFLSNLSQEGIADLIDKPLLMLPNSPVKHKTELFFQDEKQLAATYISKLDSLLQNSEGNFTQSFQTLFNGFSKNGGHIPGKIMGATIRDCGLLPDILPAIEDPVLFFEVYNVAVKKCGSELPVFSPESLGYLKRLRNQYYKR